MIRGLTFLSSWWLLWPMLASFGYGVTSVAVMMVNFGARGGQRWAMIMKSGPTVARLAGMKISAAAPKIFLLGLSFTAGMLVNEVYNYHYTQKQYLKEFAAWKLRSLDYQKNYAAWLANQSRKEIAK